MIIDPDINSKVRNVEKKNLLGWPRPKQAHWETRLRPINFGSNQARSLSCSSSKKPTFAILETEA
jgi:hypothetical protein